VTGWVIRDIADYDEARRCVEFQRSIWGADFSEIVPAAILWVVARNGGVVAGAFDGDELVGFLLGLTGLRDRQLVHWSDMLAVSPAARGRGIGQALKRYQRQRLLDAGIALCNWTFDPLEARNAHLNFARLGVTSATYVRDCYGTSDSPLHRGLPTDRLIVDWLVDSPRVRGRMEDDVGDGTAPASGAHRRTATSPAEPAPRAINPCGGEPRLDLEDETLRLLIPPRIRDLAEAEPAVALQWRHRTRAAFEEYFGRGYRAMEVEPAADGLFAYVLRSG
jgi:chorismate synthase